jgi:hypothetical protein
MDYPPLHPQARKARLTLAICEAFHTNRGPARPRSLASSAPRPPPPLFPAPSKTKYNNIVQAALAIHQRVPCIINTRFLPSPLLVLLLIYPPHPLPQYLSVLHSERHHRALVYLCSTFAHILLPPSFHQNCLLPRSVHLVPRARLRTLPSELMIPVHQQRTESAWLPL